MGNCLSEDFKQSLTGELPEYASGLIDALENSDPSVAVRINPLKSSALQLPLFPGMDDGDVAWCPSGGIYLKDRPDFTHDPRLHQGLYYVQDASSMAVGAVAGWIAGNLSRETDGAALRYLDACAAPGGKTTAAIAALPADALVVANEFDFRRAEILKENVIKWGAPGVAVSRGDTARFRKLAGFFHVVAADVPCSGEGMMRKDAKAAAQWSAALVEQCAARQKEIVANLWEALMPGGYLIYSTCTFNRHENEEIIHWIARELGGEPVELPLDFPGAVKTDVMYRFLPGAVRGEGLALGVVRKPGEPVMQATGKSVKKQGGNSDKISGGLVKKLIAPTDGWLSGDTAMMARELSGGEIVAVPSLHSEAFGRMRKVLDLIHSGITLGTVKGKNIVPDQSLAMSVMLRRGAFPEVEVDREEAIRYLRREAAGGFDAPKGYLLLTFGGVPLGFVNHLGNRSNNLYPQPWRILH